MDILTLLFAVVAVVIFLRLRNVLGTRNGMERPPRGLQKPATKKTADVITLKPQAASVPMGDALPEPVIQHLDHDVAAGLKSIAAADAGFKPQAFLDGAKAAYEMIMTAFAKGDRATLRKLLSAELYDNFDEDITDREAKGETLEQHFIGFEKADFTGAVLKGTRAEVSVAYVAKLVQAKRNEAGEVIEGDAALVTMVTDSWTFARKVGARDPNWQLIAVDAD